MKNFLLVAFLALVSTSVFSQFNLTQSNMPQVGDTGRYQFVDTTGFDPGPSGTGVTWDFSGAADSSNSFRQEFVDPASTPGGAAFTDPNTVAFNNGLGDFFYYNSAADSFYLVGESTQFTLNTAAVYSNPLRIFDFPFTPTTSTIDDCNSTFTVQGITFIRVGSDSVTQSGSGTLITPDSTYQNVIRIFKTISLRDSGNVLGLVVINTFNTFTFEWYTEDDPLPVMVAYQQDINLAGNPTQDKWAFYRMFGDTMTSAVAPEVALESVDVYPNPTAGETRIAYQLNQSTHLKIEVFNLLGNRVKVLVDENQTPGNHTLKVNAAGLRNGTYILRFQTDNSLTTRKVVVLH